MQFHGFTLLHSFLIIYTCLHVTRAVKTNCACKGDKPIMKRVIDPGINLTLSPSDSCCKVGDPLVAQCKYTGPGLVQYFTLLGQHFDVNSSSVISYGNDTLQLSYANLTEDMNNERIACCAPAHNRCLEGKVTVGYEPLEPFITAKIYREKSRTIEFSWMLNITHRLFYTLHYYALIRGSYVDEPPQNFSHWCNETIKTVHGATGLFSCTYTLLQNRRIAEKIKIVVKGKNAVDKIVKRRQYNLRLISKMEPVGNLKLNASSKIITVTWNYTVSNDLDSLNYNDTKVLDVQLCYTPNNSASSWVNMTSKKGTVGQYLFKDLRPFTKYSIFVRVKSQQSEVWSDLQNRKVQTLPSVPGANPIVRSGGFESREKHNGSRDVVFYWQEVPELLRHGVIIGYVVSCTHGKQKTSFITNMTSLTINGLPLEEETLLSVEARTTEGINHNLPVEVISVPPASSIPSIPANFTTIVVDEKYGLVNLSWAIPSSDTRSITVWYCKRRHDRTCEGPIYWKLVKERQMSEAVTLDNLPGGVSEMAYGLSVNVCKKSKCANSGINWGDNLYYLDGYARAPKVAFSAAHALPEECKISLFPTKIVKEGYVYSYKLTYCALNEGHICSEKKVMYVNSEMREVTIQHLAPHQTYKLNVTSLTVRGESLPYESNCTTSKKFFTKQILVIMVVVSVVLFVFLVIGTAVCIRMPVKCYEGVKKQLKIPISTPENPEKEEEMNDRPIGTVPPFSNPNLVLVTPRTSDKRKFSGPSEIDDEDSVSIHSAGNGDMTCEITSMQDFGIESASPYSRVTTINRVSTETFQNSSYDLSPQLSDCGNSISSLASLPNLDPNTNNLTVKALESEPSHEESSVINALPLKANQTGRKIPQQTMTIGSESANSGEPSWFPVSLDMDACFDNNKDPQAENMTDVIEKSTEMSEDSDQSMSDHGYASGKTVKAQFEFLPVPDEPAVPVGQSSGMLVSSHSKVPVADTLFTDPLDGPAKDHMAYNLPGTMDLSIQGNNHDSSESSLLSPQRGNIFSDINSWDLTESLDNHAYADCSNDISNGHTCRDAEEDEEEDEDCDESTHFYI